MIKPQENFIGRISAAQETAGKSSAKKVLDIESELLDVKYRLAEYIRRAGIEDEYHQLEALEAYARIREYTEKHALHIHDLHTLHLLEGRAGRVRLAAFTSAFERNKLLSRISFLAYPILGAALAFGFVKLYQTQSFFPIPDTFDWRVLLGLIALAIIPAISHLQKSKILENSEHAMKNMEARLLLPGDRDKNSLTENRLDEILKTIRKMNKPYEAG